LIEAYFDSSMGRKGLITGAYQYDTGQRLRLSGLPSPDELAEMDDFLSGDLVTVSVQYSRVGDTQGHTSLAIWDEDRWVWMANIPDEYLSRHVTVNVQVRTYYGSDGAQERGKTMFEGSFVPISCAAPNNTVSDDQIEQWENLEQEVQLSLVPLETATDKARDAAEEATTASNEANQSAANANAAADRAENALAALLAESDELAGLSFQVTHLAAGSSATATKNGNTITLGIPRGANGAKGATGDTGPSDLTFSMSDGVLTITPK